MKMSSYLVARIIDGIVHYFSAKSPDDETEVEIDGLAEMMNILSPAEKRDLFYLGLIRFYIYIEGGEAILVITGNIPTYGDMCLSFPWCGLYCLFTLIHNELIALDRMVNPRPTLYLLQEATCVLLSEVLDLCTGWGSSEYNPSTQNTHNLSKHKYLVFLFSKCYDLGNDLAIQRKLLICGNNRRLVTSPDGSMSIHSDSFDYVVAERGINNIFNTMRSPVDSVTLVSYVSENPPGFLTDGDTNIFAMFVRGLSYYPENGAVLDLDWLLGDIRLLLFDIVSVAWKSEGSARDELDRLIDVRGLVLDIDKMNFANAHLSLCFRRGNERGYQLAALCIRYCINLLVYIVENRLDAQTIECRNKHKYWYNDSYNVIRIVEVNIMNAEPVYYLLLSDPVGEIELAV